MDTGSRQAHWDKVYTDKRENELSWFQESPALSVELIAEVGATTASALVDVGGGASRLVDLLVERGFQAITIVDISEAAISIAKTRLGDSGRSVQWVVADVTMWQPAAGAYDVWHDRAAFHFLTEEHDRAAYVAHLRKAVRLGGHAIIGTFALDGPEWCSGLRVARYDARSLGETVGQGFELLGTRRHAHLTPWGSEQRFQFSWFRKRA